MTKVLDITNVNALSSVYALPEVHFQSSFDSEAFRSGTDRGLLHRQKTLPVPELRSGVPRGGAPQIFRRRTWRVQADSGRLSSIKTTALFSLRFTDNQSFRVFFVLTSVT
jgi:hypothetical protein